MQRSSVDLPEPEAPISATASCSRTVEVDPAQDLALAEGLGHAADLEHRGRCPEPPAALIAPPPPGRRRSGRRRAPAGS